MFKLQDSFLFRGQSDWTPTLHWAELPSAQLLCHHLCSFPLLPSLVSDTPAVYGSTCLYSHEVTQAKESPAGFPLLRAQWLLHYLKTIFEVAMKFIRRVSLLSTYLQHLYLVLWTSEENLKVILKQRQWRVWCRYWTPRRNAMLFFKKNA